MFTVSSEYMIVPNQFVHRSGQTTFPEFPSYSRHQQRESTYQRVFQRSLTVRPQRFSRSRRVTLLFTLEACFILQPRPGFTFQGLCPLSRQAASSAVCTLLSLRSARLTGKLPSRLQLLEPRLQGFAPNSDPLPTTGGLARSFARSPLKFSPFQAFLRPP